MARMAATTPGDDRPRTESRRAMSAAGVPENRITRASATNSTAAMVKTPRGWSTSAPGTRGERLDEVRDDLPEGRGRRGRGRRGQPGQRPRDGGELLVRPRGALRGRLAQGRGEIAIEGLA